MTNTTTNNPQMRAGFTMIELIFVIVIIGILASVAIPRLAATRDDAKISKTVSNLKVVLNDSKSYYAAHGGNDWVSGSAVNWNTVTDAVDATQGAKDVTNAINIKGDQANCFTVTPANDANGTTLTVTYIGDTDVVCTKAKALAANAGIVSTDGNKTVQLGGQSVTF